MAQLAEDAGIVGEGDVGRDVQVNILKSFLSIPQD